jgi:hypothetical protein
MGLRRKPNTPDKKTPSVAGGRSIMDKNDTCMGIFRFTEHYKDLFDSVVYPVVATHTGLVTHDARSYYEPYAVKMDLIEKMIREARLVIVDISEENGNVFFEFGIGFAHGKPRIILCSQQAFGNQWNGKLPFDINGRDLLIYDDKTDLRLKLGRNIVDALYQTSRETQSWSALSPRNYVKSATELDINVPSDISSDKGVTRPFTLAYEGMITRVFPPSPGEERGSHPDIRVHFTRRPNLLGDSASEKDSYPRIVIIFPWEYIEQNPSKYECHVDYFTAPGQETRLQQVAVAKKVPPDEIGLPDPYRFKFFINFGLRNLVVESDLFEDDTPRVEVPLSNFQWRGYPINEPQYIGFEAINCSVVISNIVVKKIDV